MLNLNKGPLCNRVIVIINVKLAFVSLSPVVERPHHPEQSTLAAATAVRRGELAPRNQDPEETQTAEANKG